jgi:hypothetical protein
MRSAAATVVARLTAVQHVAPAHDTHPPPSSSQVSGYTPPGDAMRIYPRYHASRGGQRRPVRVGSATGKLWEPSTHQFMGCKVGDSDSTCRAFKRPWKGCSDHDPSGNLICRRCPRAHEEPRSPAKRNPTPGPKCRKWVCRSGQLLHLEPTHLYGTWFSWLADIAYKLDCRLDRDRYIPSKVV